MHFNTALQFIIIVEYMALGKDTTDTNAVQYGITVDTC